MCVCVADQSLSLIVGIRLVLTHSLECFLARFFCSLLLLSFSLTACSLCAQIFPVGLFALSERHLVRQLLSSSFQTRTSRGRNGSTVGSSGGSNGGEGGSGETCEEVCRDDGCEEAARGAEALVFLYCTVSQVGRACTTGKRAWLSVEWGWLLVVWKVAGDIKHLLCSLWLPCTIALQNVVVVVLLACVIALLFDPLLQLPPSPSLL